MTIWDSFDHLKQTRLYRDVENARIAGVCAGIADYLGVRKSVVRAATIVGLIFFFVPTLVVYCALALVLPKKPPALYASREEERFWRGMRTAPDETLQALHLKFTDLEQRLAGMEMAVTSEEFELRRKFRDIGA